MRCLDDYLIDQRGIDWPGLLVDWAWLLPSEYDVWLANRYADLFVVPPDGTVHMLDVGLGSLTKLADDRQDFARELAEAGNAEDWFMVPLVDELVAAGIRLQSGQCYSLLLPPILGGGYTAANTTVLCLAEHFGVYASYHEQLRGVPDGSQVVIEIRRNKPPQPQA